MLMSRNWILLVCGLAPAWALSQPIAFPPASLGDLVGHSVCDLPEHSWVGRFRLPLENAPKYALEYRKSGSFHAISLLAADPESLRKMDSYPSSFDRCSDKILATVELKGLQPRETVTFDCSSSDRTALKKVIVGIGDNQSGKLRRFAPRQAWIVETDPPRFQGLPSLKGVRCEVKNRAGSPRTSTTNGWDEHGGAPPRSVYVAFP